MTSIYAEQPILDLQILCVKSDHQTKGAREGQVRGEGNYWSEHTIQILQKKNLTHFIEYLLLYNKKKIDWYS